MQICILIAFFSHYFHFEKESAVCSVNGISCDLHWFLVVFSLESITRTRRMVFFIDLRLCLLCLTITCECYRQILVSTRFGHIKIFNWMANWPKPINIKKPHKKRNNKNNDTIESRDQWRERESETHNSIYWMITSQMHERLEMCSIDLKLMNGDRWKAILVRVHALSK